VYATARLVGQDLRAAADHPVGEDLEAAVDDEAVELHNRVFDTSYERWLEALYLGKYEIFGDAELVHCAFLVDTSLYYLGVVTPVYKDVRSLANPPFGIDKPQAAFAHLLMRTFNRRLRKLARMRRIAGTYGRRNAEHRVFTPAFGLGFKSVAALRSGLFLWLRLETEHALSRLRLGWPDVSRPVRHRAEPGTSPT